MLNLSAQYALRIMAFLALDRGPNLIRAKDLAEEVNIPVFYLSKIMRRMVKAGLLTGSKGHGGGFRVARPPSKIRFADIFEAVKGNSEPVMCVFGWDTCSDRNPCVLHQRWQEARRSFQSWSKKTTLADVQRDVLSRVAAGDLASLGTASRRRKRR